MSQRPIACLPCGLIHHLPEGVREAAASIRGFADRHADHQLRFVLPADEGAWELMRGNADVKAALQAEQTMTVTNLHSLASSATAGWSSASVDNTANLYLDAWLQIVLDPANTAPANSKSFFVYAYGGTNSGDFTTTGAATGGTPGTEGALTFPDVTANPVGLPRIGLIPYVNADVIQKSRPFSIGLAFGGELPPFWGAALINHSGAALASSLNTVKYRGKYATVI